MVRDYELMYMVRADLDEEGLAAANDQVASLIAAQGGEVLRSTSWGRRRLAYDVQKMRDAHYMLLELRLDGSRVRELERQLHISDTVFRHMLTILVPGQEEEPADKAGDRRRAAPADGRAPRAALADTGETGDNQENQVDTAAGADTAAGEATSDVGHAPAPAASDGEVDAPTGEEGG